MIGVYLILVLMLALGYYLLLVKYGKLWDGIQNKTYEINESFTVSVLVAFRNEESNLPQLLKSFEGLETHNYKVEYVFINDHSTDNGVGLVANALPHSNIINLQDEFGKKAAIAAGISASNGDIILQTDADCVVPEKWLVDMIEPFQNPKVNLVSGPVQFFESKGFWVKLINLDFTALIAIGAAHIAWKKPLLCNGANMAYRRSLAEGFEYGTNKASGDDVFLLQHAASISCDGFVFKKTQDAIVYSEGPSSFSEFWNQRLRWSSKNSDYTDKLNSWILIGIWFYNLLIIISLLSFSPVGVSAAVFLIIVKIIAEDSFYGKFCGFFTDRLWFTNIFLGQPFHILYMAILPPLSQILKYKWKERKVN